MQMIVIFLCGLAFGFAITTSGVTNYDVVRDMFLLRSPHLYGVMFTALGVQLLPNFLMAKNPTKALLTGETIDMSEMKLSKNHIYGGIIGGTGWALLGVCPAAAVAQFGYGSLAAIFSITGVLIGLYLFSLVKES